MADESEQSSQPTSPKRREFLKKMGKMGALAALPLPFLGSKEGEPQLEHGLQFPAVIGMVYRPLGINPDSKSGRPLLLNPNSQPVSGRSVSLLRETDKPGYFELASLTRTNEGGYYYFGNIEPGVYQIEIGSDLQDEKEQSEGLPTQKTESPDGSRDFTVGSDTKIILGPIIGILTGFQHNLPRPKFEPIEPPLSDPKTIV